MPVRRSEPHVVVDDPTRVVVVGTAPDPAVMIRPDDSPTDAPSRPAHPVTASGEQIRPGGRYFGMLAGVGFAAASAAVFGGGRTVTPTTVPTTSWFGLLAAHGPGTTTGLAFGVVLFTALITLVVVWVAAVRAAERGELSERRVWLLGATWGAPFVLGPPIISKDVHAFAAQGILAYHGIDPYTSNVFALSRVHSAAAGRALVAVDPRWRPSLSPYGPVATFLERAAAQLAGGNPIGTIVALRVAAALSVVALGIAAASLGHPRRAVAVACVLLNPLVLVHAVSGVHFEAEMGALIVAGFAAAKRRSWVWAIVAICAAGSVKAPAFAVLPMVIAAHIRHRSAGSVRWRPVVLTAVGDVAVAIGCTAAFAASVPNGLGWVRNLGTPSQSSTASVAGGLSVILRVCTPQSWSGATRLTVTVALLTVAVVVILRLTLNAGVGAVEAGGGLALVALALLLPVFYSWYLLWGATCWLVVARPALRDRLLALCGVATVFGATGTPAVVARTLDLLAAIAAIIWLLRRAQVANPPPAPLVTPTPTPTGSG